MIYWMLLALAVENAADMLTGLDLFEPGRVWFENSVPRFSKLARCKYCQTFWLFGLCVLLLPPFWLVAWFAGHRIIQLISEFYDRYLNRAPITICDVSKMTRD